MTVKEMEPVTGGNTTVIGSFSAAGGLRALRRWLCALILGSIQPALTGDERACDHRLNARDRLQPVCRLALLHRFPDLTIKHCHFLGNRGNLADQRQQHLSCDLRQPRLSRFYCLDQLAEPIAPARLDNMNRFLKYWRRSGRNTAYQAHVVSYADDFVILSRGHAEEAKTWTGRVMTRLG